MYFSQIDKVFIRNESWINLTALEASRLLNNKPSDLTKDESFERALKMFSNNEERAIVFLSNLYVNTLDKLIKLDYNESASMILV
ncbi:MAG TPA: hypothetical protein EYG89_06540 [Bacteroidia bacterium]|nr:hypothetical protein [Bacteroidia bacterium]